MSISTGRSKTNSESHNLDSTIEQANHPLNVEQLLC